ncbi:MAG: hypothetical protein ACTSU6_04035 [Candidatus Njordarchaeales archaeon]
MKKSEVVELIKKVVLKNVKVTPKELSILILEAMLEVDMLPPSIEFKMGNSTIRDNIWESEDEQV